jgi:hypothetical protein
MVPASAVCALIPVLPATCIVADVVVIVSEPEYTPIKTGASLPSASTVVITSKVIVSAPLS